MAKKYYALLGLLCIAQHSVAGFTVGTPAGVQAGRVAGDVVGSVAGGAVPLGLGGIAIIAALSLIIGAQLIKRKSAQHVMSPIVVTGPTPS